MVTESISHSPAGTIDARKGTEPARNRSRWGDELPVPFPSPAWSDAWLGYELAEQAKGHTAKTINTRRSSVMSLARRYPSTSPEDLTKNDLRRHFSEIRKTQKPGGVASAHNELATFFKWLASDTGITSPMLGLVRPKVVMPDVPVLTPQQLKALLSVCKGDTFPALRDRALILLLMESGLRRTECISLHVNDLDLRSQTAVVRRGKGGRGRTICYGADTANAIRKYLRVRDSHLDALFLNHLREPLCYPGIGQILKRRGDQAGIEGLRPHILRHTWCHYQLAGGTGDSNVITLAGWVNGAQLRRYGRQMAVARAVAASRANPVGAVIRRG